MVFRSPQKSKRKRNPSRSPNRRNPSSSPNKRRKVEEWECPICFEGQETGVLEVSKCGHVFHEKCIDHLVKLKKYKCPLCRKRLFAKKSSSSSSNDDSDNSGPKKVWNPFPGYKNNMLYSIR